MNVRPMIFFFYIVVSLNEISHYSSEEISGNEWSEKPIMTEIERQAEINRQKEEMKMKRRKKKRTSSSMQSSTFKGKPTHLLNVCARFVIVWQKLA